MRALANENIRDGFSGSVVLSFIFAACAILPALILSLSLLAIVANLTILLISQSIFLGALGLKAHLLKRTQEHDVGRTIKKLRLLAIIIFLLFLVAHGLVLTGRVHPVLVSPALLLLIPARLILKQDVFPHLGKGWHELEERPSMWFTPPAARGEETRELPREQKWFQRWVFDPAYHHMEETEQGFGAVLEMNSVLTRRVTGGLERPLFVVLLSLVILLFILYTVELANVMALAISIEFFILLCGGICLGRLPRLRGKAISFLYLLPVPAKKIVDHYIKTFVPFPLLFFFLLFLPFILLSADRPLVSLALSLHVMIFVEAFIVFLVWELFATMKDYLPGRSHAPSKNFKDTLKLTAASLFFFLYIPISFVLGVLFYVSLHPLLGLLFLAVTIVLLLSIPHFYKKAITAYDQISVHG